MITGHSRCEGILKHKNQKFIYDDEPAIHYPASPCC